MIRMHVLYLVVWLSFIALVLQACQATSPPLTTIHPPHLTFDIPTQGTCDGLPQVEIGNVSSAIECIGLLDEELVFPRGMSVWQQRLLVVDKGANLHDRTPHLGAVYAYDTTNPSHLRRRILANLDQPNGIAVWRNRLAFVTTQTQVLRFDPAVHSPTAEVVIEELPTQGWHALTAVHIQGDALFLSIPSATDHCEIDQSGQMHYPCPETAATTPQAAQSAVIRRYHIDSSGNLSSDFEIVARGLRDALALTSHPTQPMLYTADNGWDNIDLSGSSHAYSDTPSDEVNVIALSNNKQIQTPHFGWPYCFDETKITPGYHTHNINCADYHAPSALLPAHSAPLGMAFIDQALWLNLHGYAQGGQRTVRIPLEVNGDVRLGADIETIIHWDYTSHNGYGIGRPFAIVQLDDTTLVVSDDWNHALFQVKLAP